MKFVVQPGGKPLDYALNGAVQMRYFACVPQRKGQTT